MASSTLPSSLERELGHGTTSMGAAGWPYDPSEWSAELQWPLNIAVFDRMRRQDAQTGAVLRAVTLPIRRAAWSIDPNGARDEVVAHIAADFGLPILGAEDASPRPNRERGRFQWDEHLRLALLKLSYGHMPFEQVYRIDDQVLARLVKLAPRMPATLAKINVARDGGLESIEQYPSGMPGDTGLTIKIPIDRLIMYVTDREAGAWQGQSILRSAYKHWMLKDRLIRVDAMKHERNGMGVPWIESPQNATPAQIAELNTLAQSYRAGESSGAALPAGAKLHLAGTEGATPDTLASIRYHDEQIARNVLAQFLQLGSTETGSRALGESFIDFFVMCEQTYADDIAQTVTAYAVEDLVDLNWGEEETAPKVVCEAIGAGQEATAESIKALIDSRAITADDDLETWLRERYRMPARGGEEREPPAPTPRFTAARGKVRARSAGRAATAPTADYQTTLTGHYSDALMPALAGLLDPADVAAGWLALRPTVVAAAADPNDLALANVYARSLTLDTDALVELITEMYGESYLAGAHAAGISLDQLGVDVPDTLGTGIDWDTWTPGNHAAAAELAGADAGRGLGQLLAEVQIQINGITGTILDDLGRTLAEGVDQGLSRTALAKSIGDLVGDSYRAELIAGTESARAVTVASLDQYRVHQVQGKEWLLSDGACPECEENADAGVLLVDEEFPNGDPPAHPNCVCAVGPVVE